MAIDVVEMFDPKTSNWAKLTAMPEAWAEMTTGPLPVFANGVVLIPHSYRNKRGIVGSLKYDTIKDTWVEGTQHLHLGTARCYAGVEPHTSPTLV